MSMGCELAATVQPYGCVEGSPRGGNHTRNTTTDEAARIKQLEAEVLELKRANEIMLTASSFFAWELDSRLP